MNLTCSRETGRLCMCVFRARDRECRVCREKETVCREIESACKDSLRECVCRDRDRECVER